MAKTIKKKEDSGPPRNSLPAAEELRRFIERWEALDADKRAIADEQKEIMAEAKSRGYDTKIMRRIIAERKRDSDEIAEEEAILDLYRSALGMYIGLGLSDDDDAGDDEGDDEGMA